MAAGGKILDGRQIHVGERGMVIVGVFGGRGRSGDFLCLRYVMRRNDARVFAAFRQHVSEVFESGAIIRSDVVAMAAIERRLVLAVSLMARGRMLLMARQMRRMIGVLRLRRAVMTRMARCIRCHCMMTGGMLLGADMMIAAVAPFMRAVILMSRMSSCARSVGGRMLSGGQHYRIAMRAFSRVVIVMLRLEPAGEARGERIVAIGSAMRREGSPLRGLKDHRRRRVRRADPQCFPWRQRKPATR